MLEDAGGTVSIDNTSPSKSSTYSSKSILALFPFVSIVNEVDVGVSFMGITLKVTRADADSHVPSLTLKEKLSEPK